MADLELVKELSKADDFLAVIATARPDGTVHASLVKAGVVDDPVDGSPAVGTVIVGQARKLAYLRGSGRATVVFKHGWRWVAVEGPVRLVGPDDPPPETLERSIAALVREIYRAAGGTHDDWEEFDRVMAEDRRTAAYVAAARVSSNR
jgi:hypothetical protein